MIMAADSAADRVAALAARHRHAAELARYASLAVRVDMPLLRRLRLAMLPGADASAEADLWFSTLSESRGDEGLVFDAEVAALLRRRLAGERLADGTSALDAAWRHTAALHERWPASLQLEERLTYLALAQGSAAGAQIEEALQPAMVAMASGEQRALEVARWAVRAVPRLPPAARDSEAAGALALAAMAVLDSGINAVAGTPLQAMPAHLGWLLPATVFSRRATLACEVSTGGLLLRAARGDDPPDALVDLPLTRPLMLELRWSVDGKPASRLHPVEPGAMVPLPEGWRELRVRTLDGALYAIEPAVADAAQASHHDLLQACVRVQCGEVRARGVLIAPGRVLTTGHAVREAREGPSGAAQEIHLLQGTLRWPARLDILDSRVDLALLATDAMPDQPPMPRAAIEAAPGDAVMLVAEAEATAGPLLLPGKVAAVGIETRVDDRAYGDLFEIRLDHDPPSALAYGLSGSPVVQGSAMVGLLGWRGNRELYATSARTIARFLAWAMRPPEHFPDVFVGYAPQDNYKGRDLDEGAVVRVRQALQTARLRAWLSEDLQRAPESEDLQHAMNRAEGAVCLLTPVAGGRGVPAERDLAAIAFRRWAGPAFPVVLLTYRSSAPALPALLQPMPTIVLDAVDDETLWQQLQDRLEGEARAAPEPSEAAFADAVLRTLDLPPSTVVDDTVLDRLVQQWVSAATNEPPDTAVAKAELAAMAALPSGDTLQRLRETAEAATGQRAVYLNAMPVQYARLLLKKAWYPRSAPPHVVIRDQDWPTDGDASALVAQVVQQVGTAIGSPEHAVRWVLGSANTAYVVIFATRPMPQADLIARLHAALPGALLFFLGTDMLGLELLTRLDVRALPALPDVRVSLEWMQRYKQLMNVAAPREGGRRGKGRPSSKAS